MDPPKTGVKDFSAERRVGGRPRGELGDAAAVPVAQRVPLSANQEDHHGEPRQVADRSR